MFGAPTPSVTRSASRLETAVNDSRADDRSAPRTVDDHADVDGDGAVDRREAWRAAAMEAELESGRREESIEQAKRHIIVRIGIIIAGVFVTFVGGLLLVLPGPGWLVIFVGLLILSAEVPFAARMLDKVKKRLPQDADGKLPKSAIVTMVLIFVAATAFSIWFTVLR